VSKHFHNMQHVSGLVVFHGGFSVAEGVEGDLVDPLVLQFRGDASSLSAEGSGAAESV
jgi:hypothetical protein